jgi:hypothetical protein
MKGEGLGDSAPGPTFLASFIPFVIEYLADSRYDEPRNYEEIPLRYPSLLNLDIESGKSIKKEKIDPLPVYRTNAY